MKQGKPSFVGQFQMQGKHAGRANVQVGQTIMQGKPCAHPDTYLKPFNEYPTKSSRNIFGLLKPQWPLQKFKVVNFVEVKTPVRSFYNLGQKNEFKKQTSWVSTFCVKYLLLLPQSYHTFSKTSFYIACTCPCIEDMSWISATCLDNGHEWYIEIFSSLPFQNYFNQCNLKHI